jgi:Flp pilus assembly protein TadG
MRFVKSESGSISIVFAGTLILVLGVIALSIDGSNAVRVRQQIQNAMDAAALAGARAKMMGEDAEAAIEAALAANWGSNHPDLPITIGNVSVADGVVRIAATAKSPAMFGPMIGYSELSMSIGSEAAYGVGDVEIALVLDNTDSMCLPCSKLGALKAAAHTLVDTVTAADDADAHVKISLVPFGEYVNVGLGYRGANWLSVDDDSSETSNQCWNTYPNATSSNCRQETVNTTSDGMPYSYETTVCDWDYGDPVEVCGDITTSHTWSGCVGSRDYPADLSDLVTPASPVPGLMDRACSSPLTRLSSDWADISSKIDAFSTSGMTYIPAGLTWGWRTLSHRPPFADGADPALTPDIRKILVLMTDGANTRSPSYPHHENNDRAVTDGLTAELCTKIKDEGITIYTVSFQVADSDARNMLEACASSPIAAYNADDASELEHAFEAIGGAIVALRLSK